MDACGHRRLCGHAHGVGRSPKPARLGSTWFPKPFRSPHLTGIRLGGLDPREVSAALSAEDVHTSVRGTSIRVSAHGFNTLDDVDRLCGVLRKVLS